MREGLARSPNLNPSGDPTDLPTQRATCLPVQMSAGSDARPQPVNKRKSSQRSNTQTSAIIGLATGDLDTD